MPLQVILSRVPLAALRAVKRPRGPMAESFIDVSFEVLPRAVSFVATRNGASEGFDVIPKMRPASGLSVSKPPEPCRLGVSGNRPEFITRFAILPTLGAHVLQPGIVVGRCEANQRLDRTRDLCRE